MAFTGSSTYRGRVEVDEMLRLASSVRVRIAEVHSNLEGPDLRDELGLIVGKMRVLEEMLKALDADLAPMRQRPGFSQS